MLTFSKLGAVTINGQVSVIEHLFFNNIIEDARGSIVG
jgi:hypothetical protein